MICRCICRDLGGHLFQISSLAYKIWAGFKKLLVHSGEFVTANDTRLKEAVCRKITDVSMVLLWSFFKASQMTRLPPNQAETKNEAFSLDLLLACFQGLSTSKCEKICKVLTLKISYYLFFMKEGVILYCFIIALYTVFKHQDL